MRDYKEDEVQYLDYTLPSWSKHTNRAEKTRLAAIKSAIRQQQHVQSILFEVQHTCNVQIKSSQSKASDSKLSNLHQGKTILQLVKMIQQEEQEAKKRQILKDSQFASQEAQIKRQDKNLHESSENGRNPTNSNSLQNTQPRHQNQTNGNGQVKSHISSCPQTVESKQNSRLQKQLQAYAKTKICWPNIQVNYFDCTLNLSLRSIHQYQCDVLFIPFLTHNLQYYPGSILKSMLESQRSKLQKLQMYQGSIYIKSSHQLTNFKYLVFVKVKPENLCSAFSQALSSLFQKPKSKLVIRQILFCLDDKQIKLPELISGILACKQLKKQSQIQLSISAQQGCDFKSLCRQFQQKLLGQKLDI